MDMFPTLAGFARVRLNKGKRLNGLEKNRCRSLRARVAYQSFLLGLPTIPSAQIGKPVSEWGLLKAGRVVV